MGSLPDRGALVEADPAVVVRKVRPPARDATEVKGPRQDETELAIVMPFGASSEPGTGPASHIEGVGTSTGVAPEEPSTPDLDPAVSSSSDMSSDEALNDVADESTEHFVNAANGMHHLSHEADPVRLRCGKLKASLKALSSADFTA